MNSAWLRKPWSVRAALHLFAVGVALGLPLAGQAQGTKVKVVSVAGGSSALLGDFAVLTFRQGPVPQIIEDSPFKIAGYRPAGVPDSGVMVVTNVIIRDPSTEVPSDPLETVAAAMVRWYRVSPAKIHVIILLRSDSGNGVRYVGNFARIADFPSTGSGASVWKQRQSDGSFTDPNGDGLVVMQALVQEYVDGTYAGSKLRIDTGYSDVAADTIVRYANFPNLNVAGLQGLLTPASYGPVQTLLLLYNKDMVYGPLGAYQVAFSRSDVQTLVNSRGVNTRWSNISPLLLNTTVLPAHRESTSGTRNTEYTNIQRILPGSPLQFVADNGPNIATGTGPMLNFVDLEPAAFGYSFVGGVNGDMRANTRVGGYEDSDGNISYPYPITNVAGPDCSLPHNNNQLPYSDDAYQTGVIDGSYPLWSYAHVFSRPEPRYAEAAAVQADIFAALNASPNPGDPDYVHREGLLRASELAIERNYFISSITGEIVTDGQRIVPIGTAVQVGEPPDDDPNP